jgi:glycosyltransferase involved in cell wall biosynthesis
MITILYVETGSGFGGSARSLYQLLTTLDRTRFRPIVVAYHEGSAIQQIRQLGVMVHAFEWPIVRSTGYRKLLIHWVTREIPRALTLVRLILREQVDLVHLNTDLYSAVAGLWAARLLRRPIACHIRLTRAPTACERRLGRLPDCLIMLTHHARAFYHRWWPTQRIEVVYNAVDHRHVPERAVDRLRESLGLLPSARLIGLVARCVPGKGYEEFIRAATLVHTRHPEAQFLLVGNGPGGDPAYEASLCALGQQLGLNGTLVWAGWREAAEVFPSLEVAVQATSTFPEGSSRVLIEAMAFATPIVATSIATSVEILGGGEAGLLVPPGDAQALARGITRLLEDRALAQRLRDAGRRRAQALFTSERQAAQLGKLYDSLLPGNE